MVDYAPKLKKRLRELGCEFLRQGRGDHEIWRNPATGKRFAVDGKIPSPHWANNVLKQAGFEKEF